MNLPNQLTVARLLLTVVFVVLYYLPIENAVSWALLVFIIASLTDMLDGQIARKRNLVTNFGKLMDPLADKILMTAALIILVKLESLSAWIVIAILAREFFVTGIRQIAAQNGVILAAEKVGKHKLVWQVITVIYFLLVAATAEPMFAWLKPIFSIHLISPEYFGNFCTTIMTALTVFSGISYFWKNRKLFGDA